MLIVKVGGGKDINWDYICEDIARIREPLVLVHGANWQMEQISLEMGVKTKKITSPSGYVSRYTDKKTLEILLMVYAGLVNKQIVAKLQEFGVKAVGLSGIDGKIWAGERKKVVLAVDNGRTRAVRDNFQGKVISVNDHLLKLLLMNRYLPVLTTPAITCRAEIINVDNDRAIAVMAKTLGVKTIISLFEAPGLLEIPDQPKTLIKHINSEGIDEFLRYAEGGMKKKLLGAKEAFAAGVKTIYWGDGRIKNPIKNALKGKGTVIQ